MDKNILIAGGIGGMVVPALNVGLKFTGQVPSPINVNLTYMAGAVVLAAVGVATVWLLDETERKKAFIIGLSLPATISSLIGQVKKTPDTAEVLRLFTAPIALLVTTAHAAEPPSNAGSLSSSPDTAPTFALGRQFRLVGDAKGGVTVQLLDKDGNKLYRLEPNGTNLKNLPDSAVKATIETKSGSTQNLDLGEEAGTVTVATVSLEQERKLGFWQALGAPSSVTETLKTSAKVDSVREPSQELWIKRDANAPAHGATLNGTAGTAKEYIFAKKDLQGPWSNGMLLPGDKFTVLEASDPSGRWTKIKLTGLAATPTPKPNPAP